jgi:hypothetical protein
MKRLRWWDPEIQDYLFRYTDPDWCKIKKSLTDLDIDPDAVMLHGPPITGLRMKPQWGEKEKRFGQMPLADALLWIARFCVAYAEAYSSGEIKRKKPKSPDRRTDELSKAWTAYSDARIRLANALFNYPILPEDQLQAWMTAHDPADAILREMVPQLHQFDRQEVMRGGRARTFKTMHNEYWMHLTRHWLTITANVSKRRHKHLHRFLFASSKPVFREETTNEALDAFIERYVPRLGRARMPADK